MILLTRFRCQLMLYDRGAILNTRTAKKIDRGQLNNKDDGFGSMSTGRRGLDLAGLPGTNKKQSRNELEPTFRKPFSPIATKEPSKTNNVTELDKKYDMLQKTIQNTQQHSQLFLNLQQYLLQRLKTKLPKNILFLQYCPPYHTHLLH